MSRSRLIIAALVAVVVGALVAWQYSRERKIAACSSIGGIWNGAKSECSQPRPVILERERLKRG